MAARRAAPSGRNTIGLVATGAGALLLLLVPLLLVFFAFTGARNVDLPGTMIILSVVFGMALVVLGSALRD